MSDLRIDETAYYDKPGYQNKLYSDFKIVATCTSYKCIRRHYNIDRVPPTTNQIVPLWELTNHGIIDCPHCGYSLHWRKYFPQTGRWEHG